MKMASTTVVLLRGIWKITTAVVAFVSVGYASTAAGLE